MSQTRLSEPIRRSGRASKFSSATSSRSEKTPRPSAILVSSCGHHGERLEQPPKKKNKAEEKAKQKETFKAKAHLSRSQKSRTQRAIRVSQFTFLVLSFVFLSLLRIFVLGCRTYLPETERKQKKNITKSSNKWHTRTVQRPV